MDGFKKRVIYLGDPGRSDRPRRIGWGRTKLEQKTPTPSYLYEYQRIIKGPKNQREAETERRMRCWNLLLLLRPDEDDEDEEEAMLPKQYCWLFGTSTLARQSADAASDVVVLTWPSRRGVFYVRNCCWVAKPNLLFWKIGLDWVGLEFENSKLVGLGFNWASQVPPIT